MQKARSESCSPGGSKEKTCEGQKVSSSLSDFFGFSQGIPTRGNLREMESIVENESKLQTSKAADSTRGKKVNSSKCSTTSKLNSKRIALELDAARKQAEMEAKIDEMEMEMELKRRRYLREKAIIDKELQLQLSQVGSERSAKSQSSLNNLDLISEDSDGKVKDWLEKSFSSKSIHTVSNERFYNSSKIKEIANKDIQKPEIPPDVPTTSKNQVENFLMRQVVRDLPLFFGDPEEWPMFISHYRRSTESCKFSEDENILRLQKCLRGKAREVVKPLLIAAENVSMIIEMLEMNFGRPDIIIGMLTEKVKCMYIQGKANNSLLSFANAVINLTTTIKVLRADHAYMNNPQLLEELVRKLPYFLKLEWGQILLVQPKNVNLQVFSEWIQEKAKISCLVETTNFRADETRKNYSNNFKKKENVLSVTGIKKRMLHKYCPECRENHNLEDCGSFREKSEDERWAVVTENKLCICCMKTNHFKADCYKKKECGVEDCLKIHHPLLHKKQNEKKPIAELENIRTQSVHFMKPEESKVLLKILPVKVRGPNATISTYAFFDDGATVSLIDENISRRLGLKGKTEPICYTMTHGITHQEIDSKIVSLEIAEEKEESKFYDMKVRTVKNVMLPTQSVNTEGLMRKYPYVKQLGKVISYKEKQATILIGQDHCKFLKSHLTVELGKNGPALSKLLLGYAVHGKIDFTHRNDQFVYHICHQDQEYNLLNELVKDSFSTESFGVKILDKAEKTKDEIKCEEIMLKTTKRIGERFETGLLWKRENIEFPENKLTALSRLYCLENKMDRDEDLAIQYCQKIEEYVQKGYVKKLNAEEAKEGGKKIWYLPHFGVINPNKKKLRLVFDAASKTEGISLNTELFQGPDLLRPLTSVLLTFRQNRIAFTGDIREMFHQVEIRKDDRPAQRFLWRGRKRNVPPEVYEMNVMTFGATCSPCLAQYVKNTNAKEHENHFKDAARAIIKKHYVDDYLDSKCTEEEAIKQIQDVIEVHKRGGFEICGFTSNSKTVLMSIHESLRSKNSKNLDISSKNLERVLGLQWIPESDEFIFLLNSEKVNKDILTGNKIPTKRELLKFTMSVYDPMGFLTNILITIRIILQEIWKTKINWDSEIPSKLNEYWSAWIRKIQQIIPTVRIPRCYGKEMSLQESKNTEIHGFCDASSHAYSCVVYVRLQSGKKTEVSLVAAKARVCPLKPISIPRLELQGSLMLSRLVNTIISELEVEVNDIYYWTDSKTVIQWIRGENVRYKTFVAHRVGEIRELTKKEQWRWIPGSENPADEATRPNKEPEISKRWFKGPPFLLENKNNWPEQNFDLKISDDILEINKKQIFSIQTKYVVYTEFLPDISRFSSYERLIRSTAWVFRFIQNCRENKKDSKPLTVREIEEAEKYWFKAVQATCYQAEIRALQDKSEIKNSKIYRLSPYLNENGIICMKGRIYGEVYNTDFKANLVILEAKHDFTKLLIEDYHKQSHTGYEYVLNEIRQKFWIPKLRNAVKRIWLDCQQCKNKRAMPIAPEMGYLPEARLAAFKKPFTKTGVDYFGPILVTVGRRHEKRYGVMFTCLSTRAVHIEIAYKLDTASVLMAIKRLISRRGTITDIYSDNGTNFHGAEKEIRKIIQDWRKDDIIDEMTRKRIKWHFNPPAASSMGGIWERMIRSVKKIFEIIVKDKFPRDEVLQTAFAEIEHMINSRPLTYVSADPHAPESITPNHFLIGSSRGAFPDTIREDEIDIRSQWKAVQAMTNLFWKRWLKEYIPIINHRVKWHKKQDPLQEDDIVLIVDPNLPRNTWLLGRIIKTYPGRDGVVRVADVKTQSSTFRRPVSKLAKLDL